MNISFSCVDSRVENNKNIYGRFVLAPFLPGHAVTLANGLRRCLLSEVYGVAITAIEINGIKHEYSTITGIRETVLEILLNVREVVLTSEFQFQRPQIAFLQVQGPGIVRASDIKLPISIQNVRPEQHIATLLYDGVLNMKFMICCGKNFLVQTPRGLKTPKVLKETLTKKRDKFKTTIQTKKREIAYTKFSTYLKQQKDLDEKLLERPKAFYKGASQAIFEFVSTSLSIKKKRTLNKELIIKKKINKYKERKKKSGYLNSFPVLNKKSINTYRDYLIMFCKRKKKDLVFTEYLLKLREKKWKSYLPIDAVFAPVSRVNFAIENNDLSNAPKERINLEVWTNGSIHPIQAIIEAAKAFTDITLFLKDITNNKCLFINSPNKFVNMLLFKKSIDQIAQRNKQIQAHYLKIQTQNEKRVGGIKTSKDGVPLFPKAAPHKVLLKLETGGVIWVDVPKKYTSAGLNVRSLLFNVDGKTREVRKSGKYVIQKTEEWLKPYEPGAEKIQLLKGRRQRKYILQWITRARTIFEFVDRFPLQKVSTELAENLTIECEQINKDFTQFNSTIDIGNLGLSLRPYTCLKQAKIANLNDLLQKSAKDLLKIKNFGKHSLNEVENILSQYNLKLSSIEIK